MITTSRILAPALLAALALPMIPTTGAVAAMSVDTNLAQVQSAPMNELRQNVWWRRGWGYGPWGYRRWGYGYGGWGWGAPVAAGVAVGAVAGAAAASAAAPYPYYAPGGTWACPPGYHFGPQGRACWAN